jgi:sodium-dependent dicarboxylate transporter 2/3/5
LLFGRRIALDSGFEQSGLAVWIGSQLTSLETIPLIFILFILITSVNFLTEITSNLVTTTTTTTTKMLLPVLVFLAVAIDVHEYYLLVSAAVAASCAFISLAETPPNNVVFGSGYLEIQDLVKKRVWMNIISIILLIIYFILPLIWRFSQIYLF